MKIEVLRDKPTKIAMTGDLIIEGRFHCFTLEDIPRKKKVYGKTCIPEGTYEVILSFSWRFKKVLPLLLDVPDFSGVRIHGLNYASQTEGCIGVGDVKGKDYIADCKLALAVLIDKIKTAKKNGEQVFITLKNKEVIV